MKTKLAIAVALALVCSTAWSADSGFYVGGGIGMSEVKAHTSYRGSDSEGYSESGSADFSGSDFGWNIYVGYDFNKYAGVELGYIDLGKPSDVVDKGYFTDETIPFNHKVDVEATLNGIDLAVVGRVPLGESWDVHAKVGVIWWTPEAKWTHTDVFDDGSKYQEVYTEKVDSTDLLVGVGGSWKLNENIIFGLDWTHIEFNGGGDWSDWPASIDMTDLYTVNATYKF
jgi:hypothetical protein